MAIHALRARPSVPPVPRTDCLQHGHGAGQANSHERIYDVKSSKACTLSADQQRRPSQVLVPPPTNLPCPNLPSALPSVLLGWAGLGKRVCGRCVLARYMSGSQINIFSIMITTMGIWTPLSAIAGTNKHFRRV